MAFTLRDLKTLKELITSVVDERLELKLEEKLSEKLSFLPTKEEFFSRMDLIAGELQAIRQGSAFLSHKVVCRTMRLKHSNMMLQF